MMSSDLHNTGMTKYTIYHEALFDMIIVYNVVPIITAICHTTI